ncbi:hypothetical protein U1Q18_016597, partial [Sarracenia purpurea var. burkii]
SSTFLPLKNNQQDPNRKLKSFSNSKTLNLKEFLDVTESRNNPTVSPRSSTSQVSNFWRKKKEFDLFAVEKTRERTEIDRGRERGSSSSTSSRPRRGEARSLSPLTFPTTSAISSKGSRRKWRLKGFFPVQKLVDDDLRRFNRGVFGDRDREREEEK